MTKPIEPYVPPPPEVPWAVIQTLNWGDPWRWLLLGLMDLKRHPWGGLFYGICFWLMYLLLRVVFQNKPEYTMSMLSGCLLIGPFLATGLYDLSRQMQDTAARPNLARSLGVWEGHIKSMSLLVLVLVVLELLWGRASLVVFAVFFNTGLPSTSGILEALFNPENLDFLITYGVVGAVFAALVFGSSVISIPMILDRDTDAISAAITSFRVVFHNTGVMVLWGISITALLIVAMIPWGLGLLLLGPLLGHASWHCYKTSVRW
jgi:uncharacterized membrane protein